MPNVERLGPLLPMLGEAGYHRLFTADENTAAHDGAALISWDCWQTRLARDGAGADIDLTYSAHHRSNNRWSPPARGRPAGRLRGDPSLGALAAELERRHSCCWPALPRRMLLSARSGRSEFVPLLTRWRAGKGAGKAQWPTSLLVRPLTRTPGCGSLDGPDIAWRTLRSPLQTSERRGELAIRLAIGARTTESL